MVSAPPVEEPAGDVDLEPAVDVAEPLTVVLDAIVEGGATAESALTVDQEAAELAVLSP
jgi:hypothetical protein